MGGAGRKLVERMRNPKTTRSGPNRPNPVGAKSVERRNEELPPRARELLQFIQFPRCSKDHAMPQANPLRLLNAAGQSVWYDNIQRSMLTSGVLARLIAEDDLRGITSNPTIFEKAIAGSGDYDEALRRELQRNPQQSSRDLFFTLAIEDIRAAAEALRPTYDATDGVDGMVSLEVSPDLAHDVENTVREARELFARLALPNIMIKVPGTVPGLHAVERLIAEGINVNVTLLFSVERYVSVAEAYLRGLERRRAQGLPLDRVASVASFFVSRLDTALDPALAQRRPELQGQIANANAKLAYQEYLEIVGGAHFAALRAAGADRSACCGPAPAPRIRLIPICSTWTISSAPIPSTPCRRRPTPPSATMARSREPWTRRWKARWRN